MGVAHEEACKIIETVSNSLITLSDEMRLSSAASDCEGMWKVGSTSLIGGILMSDSDHSSGKSNFLIDGPVSMWGSIGGSVGVSITDESLPELCNHMRLGLAVDIFRPVVSVGDCTECVLKFNPESPDHRATQGVWPTTNRFVKPSVARESKAVDRVGPV